MKKYTAEMKQLKREELETLCDGLQRQLFELRLQLATQHMPSYPSMKRKLQKDIARAQTFLQQKIAGSTDKVSA